MKALKAIKKVTALVACALGVGCAWADSVAASNDYLRVIANYEAGPCFALALNENVNTNAGAYFTVETGSAVTKFAAKGLPTGVKLDAKNLVLTGKATKAGIYYATFTAVNANKFEFTRVIKFNVGETEEPKLVDEVGIAYALKGLTQVGSLASWEKVGSSMTHKAPGYTENMIFSISGLPTGIKTDVDKWSYSSKDEYGTYSSSGSEYELYGCCTTPGRYLVTAKMAIDNKWTTEEGTEILKTNNVSKVEVIIDGAESKWVAPAKVGVGEGTVTGGGVVVAAGKTYKTTAKAKKGYVFAGWYRDAECTQPVSPNEYQDIMLDKDGSYTVADQTWGNCSYQYQEAEAFDLMPTELYARFIPSEDDANVGVSYWDGQLMVMVDLNGAVVSVGSGFGMHPRAWTMINEIEAGSRTVVTAVKGLPAFLSFDKWDGSVDEIWYNGKDMIPGRYPVTFTVKNLSGVTKDITAIFDVPSSSNIFVAGNTESFDEETQTLTLHVNKEIDEDEALAIGCNFASEETPITHDGLPAGLKFTDGYIVGKPTKVGETKVLFSVDNEYGYEELYALTIAVVDELVVPEVEETYNYILDEDGEFDLDQIVDADQVESDTDWTLSFKGLPSGVKYVANDYVLTGKAKEAGAYPVTATFKNKNKSATRGFTLVVPDTDLVAIEDLDEDKNLDVTAGVEQEVVITADAETKLTAKGLPSGLKVVKVNDVWQIAGATTAKAGEYPVVLTAKSVEESGTFAFTVTVGYPSVDVAALYGDDSEASDKVTGEGDYAVGKKVTLKATPNKGNFFVGWESEDIEIDEAAAAKATLAFEMPNGPVAVTARFATADDDVLTVPEDMPAYEVSEEGYSVSLTDLFASAISPLKLTVTKLPAGLKYNAKTFTVSGTATKPGVYTALVKASNASDTKEVKWSLVVPNSIAFLDANSKVLDVTVPVTATLGVPVGGVFALRNDEAFKDSSKVKVSVSGLPAGVKVNLATGEVSGAPTKAGNYTVTLTAKEGKTTYTSVVNVVVEDLPVWLVGTFNGIDVGVDTRVDGEECYWPYKDLATLTIAKTGKATLTWKSVENGKVLTETAFKNLSPVSVDEDGFHYLAVSEEENATLALTVSPEYFGEVQYGVVRYEDTGDNDEEAWEGEGYLTQDLYTRKPAVEGLLNLSAKKTVTIDAETLSEAGVDDAESLTLKFGKNGAVTSTFKWKNGNKTVTGVSAATPITVDDVTYVTFTEYVKGKVYKAYTLAITLDEDGVVSVDGAEIPDEE